jgi:SAM-dependent methyltransferase
MNIMASETEGLEEVYGASDAISARKAYDKWAASYDAENIGNGYRLPGIGAAFFARHVQRDAGPFLDAGCGTGLVGEALSILGYGSIIGADISPQMLDVAKQLKAYDRLFEQDLGHPFPEEDNSFGAITCFGSLGPGHAPPSCLNEFIRITRPNGHIVLNVRPETFVEQGLKAKMDELTALGQWRLVETSPIFRPFLLTEPNLHAQVFVYSVA